MSTSPVDLGATDHAFDDLLQANRHFAEDFALAGFDGVARAGVAVVTCMDARIDVFAVLGLHLGDAHVIRNAGGRVTEDVLRQIFETTGHVQSVKIIPDKNVAVRAPPFTGARLDHVPLPPTPLT